MQNFQERIAYLSQQIGFSRNHTGSAGESIAIEALKEAHYGAKKSTKKQCGDVSFIATDGREVHIEVKAARVNSQGKYAFCLTKWGQNGKPKTCHTDSDFVLLLCVTKTQGIIPFLIPAVMLQGQNLVGIGQGCVFSGGKYDKYRQSLDSLDFIKSLTVAQGS